MSSEESRQHLTPRIIPRQDHQVSRQDISEPALKVLYRLKDAGYEAYLVGGGVRDLLLGKHPKDFDVATDALPEEAAKQFKNSRLIGRRFRLLHVRFGREIIEVATFRGHHNNGVDDEAPSQHDGHVEDGMIVRDNVYGSMEEDAWRRDFTINALYYNINDFSLVDYTNSLPDLQDRVLRCIGDAEQRYQEDPVRMLRAVRLATKLDFTIHPQSAEPIRSLAPRLGAVPPARLFEEVLKLFLSGHALKTFQLLRDYHLFAQLFPMTNKHLEEGDLQFEHFIQQGLINTDKRIADGKPVTPAFLYAIMLWKPVQAWAERMQHDKMSFTQALQIASSEVLTQQAQTVSLPRRYAVQVREIWMMQPKLTRRQGKRAFRLLEQSRFRAGYDFMLLRHQAGEQELEELCQWWTRFQEENATVQQEMVRVLYPAQRKGRRRRPRYQQAKG